MLGLRNALGMDGTAAVALVRQNTSITPGTTTATTLTITLPSVTAGHALVVATANWNTSGKAISSVTDTAGGSWAQAVSLTDSEGVQAQWFCSSHPGSASTLTITVTFAAATSAAANVSEWSYPLSVSATANSGSSGAASTTVASTSGQLVIGAYADGSNTTPTAKAPATALTGIAANGAGIAAGYQVASGTSTTISWSTSGDTIGVAYTPLTATGDVKVYTGTAFAAKPVKVWTGSAWVKKPAKVWTGTAWKTTSY